MSEIKEEYAANEMKETGLQGAIVDAHAPGVDTFGRELTPRQSRGIRALLANPSVTKAARSIGVSRQAMTGWLAEPHFRQALREAEAVALDAACRKLIGLTDTAIDVLQELLLDPDASDTTRLRSAQTVLTSLLQLRNSYSLEQRLVDIEQRLEAVQW